MSLSHQEADSLECCELTLLSAAIRFPNVYVSKCSIGLHVWVRMRQLNPKGGETTPPKFSPAKYKGGSEIFPWRNLGVSAGAGAYARVAAGLPAQGSLGRVGGVHTPMALVGPARVLLGRQDGSLPMAEPQCRSTQPTDCGTTCAGDCPCIVPHSAPCFISREYLMNQGSGSRNSG